ncbi:hypothetical protein AAFC00_006642 [Neodothiora populina]
MQIGSAALQYPGSLYLGGYDKGRLIGPYTTFAFDGPSLQDITIGVETGGNPFSFQTPENGFLITNTSQKTAIKVSIDPMAPYLRLPNKTCAAIAAKLPVFFDVKTQYYIWNTSDPDYKGVVSSPAYLGFSFPGSIGATEDVLIKVPFMLLNLTLVPPIVSAPLQYFPCQPFTPQAGDNYVLGRAFLQAAFIGRNSRQQITWLAQAPGPGASNNGLGVTGVSIQDSQTELDDIENDSSLFAQSWAHHWTPMVANNDIKNHTTVPTDSPDPTPSPIQTAISRAIAGVVLGTATGTAIIAVGFCFCLRRRASKPNAAAKISTHRLSSEKSLTGMSEESSAVALGPIKKSASQTSRHSSGQASPPRYRNEQDWYVEMPSQIDPQELPPTHPQELPARSH